VIEGPAADRARRERPLPDHYALHPAYAELAVCERFGWTLDYVASLTPGERAIVIAYDRIRIQQATA